MPIRIISTNSIRAMLAYWLKCTCSCQSRVRETAYARELARAVLEYPGGEVRIERLYVKDPGQEEIRFSWWPDGKMAQRPLDLPEDDLLALFKKGIQQNVFTPSFLQSLKRLLNRVVPTS
jgi:hypothetical protein